MMRAIISIPNIVSLVGNILLINKDSESLKLVFRERRMEKTFWLRFVYHAPQKIFYPM